MSQWSRLPQNTFADARSPAPFAGDVYFFAEQDPVRGSGSVIHEGSAAVEIDQQIDIALIVGFAAHESSRTAARVHGTVPGCRFENVIAMSMDKILQRHDSSSLFKRSYRNHASMSRGHIR